MQSYFIFSKTYMNVIENTLDIFNVKNKYTPKPHVIVKKLKQSYVSSIYSCRLVIA